MPEVAVEPSFQGDMVAEDLAWLRKKITINDLILTMRPEDDLELKDWLV